MIIHDSIHVILSGMRRVPQLGVARHRERTQRRIFYACLMGDPSRRLPIDSVRLPKLRGRQAPGRMTGRCHGRFANAEAPRFCVLRSCSQFSVLRSCLKSHHEPHIFDAKPQRRKGLAYPYAPKRALCAAEPLRLCVKNSGGYPFQTASQFSALRSAFCVLRSALCAHALRSLFTRESPPPPGLPGFALVRCSCAWQWAINRFADQK